MTAVPTPTFTARSPEDVLALVPVVLGFVPHDSVAMLTFGAASPFHARVDLPGAREEVPDAVAALLEPARRHRVRRALFVVYTDDADLGRHVARALDRDFERAGIEVPEVLRADGRRWYTPLPSGGAPAWGVPYDVSAHPFLAQAVLEGRVTHSSRDGLRESLAPEPARVTGVVAALAELSGDPPRGASEADWVGSLVARHVDTADVPDDAETARLLRALLDTAARDAAAALLSREVAAGHVSFWTDVVRRSPDPLLAAPAALLALAGWLAGSGALAWCALDRCTEVDDDYPLAGLVAQALTQAIPPEAWDDA